MKSLTSILILALCFSASGFAITDTTKAKTTKAKKTKQTKIILSPAEEKRFKAGTLSIFDGATVPFYSTAEQLIFSEQVRQTKKIN